MMQPDLLNATITLIAIVGIMIGLWYVAKRSGVSRHLAGRISPRPGSNGRTVVQIDRLRKLSIVQLDGYRFAVLTGGRSDQLVRLADAPTPEPM
ncbi:MAG: hypothetical protein B7Z58_04390 [Acidiphilium sp. 37-64-53]|uniref:hypothetical protein n=1 Tax=Acidiphilium TaxID=522 RepID=UPI000BD80B05|nr:MULTISPECIES: hypothetical protein [Acidiphilium]OYW03199.1 MAG: hypothetical protein B7Z58_04390 [Acidiphilium sp. 37-64-53]OZB30863.1 MAG: hypothetical protein B7X49_01185 [Acidiphilium sp. 34-64-41]HQT84143.1 hypothetical protein [Acidiphilium rubrum]